MYKFGADNSATGMERGYASVSGALTPENEREYGLELGSGMGMTLGNGKDGKKHFPNKYVYGYALKLMSYILSF